MRTGLWTRGEEAELVKWYKIVGAREMAARLDRGVPATRLRVSELGLRSCQYTSRHENWRILLDNPYASLSDVQKSYVAGIFDGEGYINFTNSKHWRIGIANTHRELIDWLHKTLPGSVIYDHKIQNEKWKQDWRLTLEGNVKSRAFLLTTLPFLIVKRDKAILTIEMITSLLKEQIGRWDSAWDAA